MNLPTIKSPPLLVVRLRVIHRHQFGACVTCFTFHLLLGRRAACTCSEYSTQLSAFLPVILLRIHKIPCSARVEKSAISLSLFCDGHIANEKLAYHGFKCRYMWSSQQSREYAVIPDN